MLPTILIIWGITKLDDKGAKSRKNGKTMIWAGGIWLAAYSVLAVTMVVGTAAVGAKNMDMGSGDAGEAPTRNKKKKPWLSLIAPGADLVTR